MLHRRAFFVVGIVAFTTQAAAAEGPKFSGTADLADTVQIARGFSDDKQAVSVLFRHLQAAVGGAGGQPADTRGVTVVLPVAKQDQHMPVTLDVRGFAGVQGGARAVLVVQAAGKTTVCDLKPETSQRGGKPDPHNAARAQAKERAEADAAMLPEQTPKASGETDFFQRIEGCVAPGASVQATFFLLIERDSNAADAGGLLVVDSLDVVLGQGTSSKPAK